MSFNDYISNNWGLMIIIIGLTLLLRSDIHLERRMVRQIGITNLLLLLYSVSSYIEMNLGNRPVYTAWRAWLSAWDYSILSVILVSIIMVVYPGHKRYLLMPCALNTFLAFLSIPTGLVFSISKDNAFSRGPLGYLPFVLNGIYLFYLLFRVYKGLNWERNELIHLVFMSVVAVACLIMPLVYTMRSDQWFIITIEVELFLYYVFLLQRFTKHDSLTSLLNRQCYYADIDKYGKSITALIAIDMNGLKRINDSYGHSKGDEALKAISECFMEAVGRKQHIYRIGGDEFTVLCIGLSEDAVREMVARIEQRLKNITYSCSIGYAIREENMSFDELYRKADNMLYNSKRDYYMNANIDRRKDRRKARTEQPSPESVSE